MSVAAVDSGQANETIDMLKVAAISGGSQGLFFGTLFNPSAGSTTTVSEARMISTGGVIGMVIPLNGAAGLLLRTKSCWVDTFANGSFVFNVSATAAGAPSGTEQFNYVFMNVDLG